MSTRSERADARRLRDVARGLDAAQKAIHATADNDDARAVAILTGQTYQESIATCAVLLGCVRSTAIALADGDPSEASRRLHAAADSLTEDGVVVQAEVIMAQALNRLTGV